MILKVFCLIKNSLYAYTQYRVKDKMDYRDLITVEPGKRGGKPCVRGLRITVYDVLGWLASGLSAPEIIEDFPELTTDDIMACLAFAAERAKAWKR